MTCRVHFYYFLVFKRFKSVSWCKTGVLTPPKIERLLITLPPPKTTWPYSPVFSHSLAFSCSCCYSSCCHSHIHIYPPRNGNATTTNHPPGFWVLCQNCLHCKMSPFGLLVILLLWLCPKLAELTTRTLKWVAEASLNSGMAFVYILWSTKDMEAVDLTAKPTTATAAIFWKVRHELLNIFNEMIEMNAFVVVSCFFRTGKGYFH